MTRLGVGSVSAANSGTITSATSAAACATTEKTTTDDRRELVDRGRTTTSPNRSCGMAPPRTRVGHHATGKVPRFLVPRFLVLGFLLLDDCCTATSAAGGEDDQQQDENGRHGPDCNPHRAGVPPPAAAVYV